MNLSEFSERFEGEEWRAKAGCKKVDPDIFFPNSQRPSESEAAKQICRFCEVQPECLKFAIKTNQQFGVWGGMDEDELDKYRRRLRRRPRSSD